MGKGKLEVEIVSDSAVVEQAIEYKTNLENNYSQQFSSIENKVNELLDNMHSRSTALNNHVQNVLDITNVVGGHEGTVNSAITQIRNFIKLSNEVGK